VLSWTGRAFIPPAFASFGATEACDLGTGHVIVGAVGSFRQWNNGSARNQMRLFSDTVVRWPYMAPTWTCSLLFLPLYAGHFTGRKGCLSRNLVRQSPGWRRTARTAGSSGESEAISILTYASSGPITFLHSPHSRTSSTGSLTSLLWRRDASTTTIARLALQPAIRYQIGCRRRAYSLPYPFRSSINSYPYALWW
jgi:hypothetical protein